MYARMNKKFINYCSFNFENVHVQYWDPGILDLHGHLVVNEEKPVYVRRWKAKRALQKSVENEILVNVSCYTRGSRDRVSV